MLTQYRGALVVLLIAAGCSSATPPPAAAPPSTVAQAVAEADSGLLAVNVGMILNRSAPTAERDERLAEVMQIAAANSSSGTAQRVETVRINELDEVGSAVRELVDRGVTVIATSCDDSSMPAVVDAALDEQLLAVTGCVTIPRPDLNVRSRLFIDLAGLNDSPFAMAWWANEREAASVAILSSGLIPDVDDTCSQLESSFAFAEIGLAATASFTELLDSPAELVAGAAERLADADMIAVCALTPSLNDVVQALRAAGFDQPIIVPWFGEPQVWPESTNDVFVFTPASTHGDDPSPAVQALFDALPDPDAVDVVAADTLAILASAAERAGSAGSRRLADTMRTSEAEAITGTITIDTRNATATGRSYRVLEIIDGQPTFLELVD